MQELRAKLTLNTKDWKKSLEEARHSMNQLRAGHAPTMANTFTSQLRSLREMAVASANLRLQFEHLGGAHSKLAAIVAPFTAMGAAARGLRQMVRPGEAAKIAKQQMAEAQSALVAGTQGLRGAIGKNGIAIAGGFLPADAAKQMGKVAGELRLAQEQYRKALSPVAKLSADFTAATKKRAEIQALREEIKDRRELVALSKSSLTKFDIMSQGSHLGDLSRRVVLLKDFRSEMAKLQMSQAKLSAITGGATGGTLAALDFKIAKLKKNLFAFSDTEAVRAANVSIEKARAALVAKATSLRGRIGTTEGMISPADARKQITPLKNAFKAAQDNLAREQRMPLWDRILGGGVQFLVNFGTVLKTLGSMVIGFGRVFGMVFSGIVSVVTTVAHTIISVIGSALSFVKDTVLTIGKVIGGIGVAVGTALAAGLHHAFEHAREMVNIRALTGVPIRPLTVLARAGEMTGVSPHNLATEVNRMQHNLSAVDEEGKKMQAALRALGLDIGKLRAMGPEEQLLSIGAALRELKDPADKAAAVINIFTVRGHEMIGFLNQAPEVMALAVQQVGGLAELLEKNAGKFTFISRTLEGLKIKGIGFFSGIGSGMANQLTFLAEGINKLDTIKLGERIGKSLKDALNVFIGLWADESTSVISLISLALKAAFAESVQFLAGAWEVIGEPLKATLLDAFAVVKEALIYGFEAAAPTIAKILGQTVGYASGLFAKSIVFLFENQAKGLMKIPGMQLQGAIFDVLATTLGKNIASPKETAAFMGSEAEALVRGELPASNAGAISGKTSEFLGELKKLFSSINPALSAGLNVTRDKTPEEREADQKRLEAAKTKFFSMGPQTPTAELAGAEKEWKDAFTASRMTQTTGTLEGKELGALLAKLKGIGGRLTAGMGNYDNLNEGDKRVVPEEKEKKPARGGFGAAEVTNQFERVGLFATRITTNSIDFMRRIADNTARAAAALEKLVTGTGTGAGAITHGTARYGH